MSFLAYPKFVLYHRGAPRYPVDFCECCNIQFKPFATSKTAQKIKFSIKETADLVTFTEEILNGNPHFLCSVRWSSL